MPFADAAARMEDSVFTRGGSDALWKSGGVGDGVACKVITAQPEVVERFGDQRAILPVALFKVRSNEVASPAEGDTVTIGTDTFKIVAEPLIDKHRLVWTCEAAAAA